MTMKAKLVFIMLLLAVLSCREEVDVVADNGETTVYKVAVVVPAALQSEWGLIAGWAS